VHPSLWLTLLIAVPLVGALLAMFVAKTPGRSYGVAVVAASVEMALTIVIALLYNNHIANASTFDFASRHVLSAPFGVAYDVALDGISLVMVVLCALVLLLALLGARDKRREAQFVSWLLVLTSSRWAASSRTTCSNSSSSSSSPWCPATSSSPCGAGQARAGGAQVLRLHLHGVRLLVRRILYLGFAHQHQFQGPLTFAYSALSQTSMSHGTAVWLFLAFGAAFAVKSPIWPLHTWSPITYAEAPTAGSVELSALLAKLGSYGLLRFTIGLLPLAFVTMRPIILTLAVIGILYGSALACVTPDLKRLVAYSSLAQMSFITLGS